MNVIELPHTEGCLVCGRQNSKGFHLNLHVHKESGLVTTTFVPREMDIGFAGIVHGGVLATVIDEAMVWAASWSARRFCLAAEMNIRFRQIARIGTPLRVEAKIESIRSRLIEVVGEIRDANDDRIASAAGKYVPMTTDQNAAMIAMLVDDPATAPATAWLRG